MEQISIYDTSLRDGAQSEDVSLSATDKIKIALKLDDLGIHYIEGGWPEANPVDTAFFQEIQNYDLKNAKVAAFGSTHHPSNSANEDKNLLALVACKAPVITIFGKSCEKHAKEALRIDAQKNLQIIANSIAFLRTHREEVFFDAEHFFDAYKNNAEYALSALKSAHESGAQALVLCDTNGGTLPNEITTIVNEVRSHFSNAVLGIHAHNDCGLAVANALAGVQAGARQVQGCMNGVGERCGNTNICTLIPILQLKQEDKFSCISSENLKQLSSTSSYFSEIANMKPFARQPFVGASAFAHKGGIHVSAVARNSSLYEHIKPELVGNEQRILMTEMAGRSNILSLAKKFGFTLDKDEPVVKGLFNELKKKSSLGYDYAAAEASVELLLLRKLAQRGVREFFKLIQFRVLEHRGEKDFAPFTEASVMVEVEGVVEHTAATGLGPVNALDKALKKALEPFYPNVKDFNLTDFKVRVLSANSLNSSSECTEPMANENSQNAQTGTESVVRVLIESADKDNSWVTVGVSYDIIEASWQALADAITYKLYKDEAKNHDMK